MNRDSDDGPQVNRQSNATRVTRVLATLVWLCLSVVPVVGVVVSLADQQAYQAHLSDLRQLVGGSPLGGPITFVLVQIAQVVIAPINHYVVGVLGGALYGVFWGSVLNYVGRVVGHSIAFAIARRFGRPLICRLVSESSIERLDRIAERGAYVLFLAYFLPLFPDDELSYLAGLSRMRRRRWMAANVVGQIGGSVGLAYVGAGVSSGDVLFWVFVIAVPAYTVYHFWSSRRERGRDRD